MLVLPYILRYVDGNFILSIGNAILATCLIATKFVSKDYKLFALSLLSILGLPWAVSFDCYCE